MLKLMIFLRDQSQWAPGFIVPLWTKNADIVLGAVLVFAEIELGVW